MEEQSEFWNFLKFLHSASAFKERGSDKVAYTASRRAKILCENADLSTESINILDILALVLIFWMNLVSLGLVF